MNKQIFMLPLLVVMVASLAVGAAAQTAPSQTNPVLSVYQPTPPAATGTCSIHYAERGAYCSGDIRMFEKCIPTSNTEGSWQIRSENCGDYGWLCFAADCTEPSLTVYFLMFGLPAIVIVLVIFLVIRKVRK